MENFIVIITALVALVHLYIFYFEMFAWEEKGPKIFKNFPKSLFAETKLLAANQGLYNGFLSAGLIWSLLINDPIWSMNIAGFFFGCVSVAGIYGAITTDRKIFFTQALPAIVGLISVALVTYL